jgi:hypothetical protein
MRPNPQETADDVHEVRWFGHTRLEWATDKDAAAQPLDRMVLCVHCGNCMSRLAPDYERYHRQSFGLEQVVIISRILWSCGQMKIIDAQFSIRNERRPIRSWM